MLKLSNKAHVFLTIFESRRTIFSAGRVNVRRRISTVTVFRIFPTNGHFGAPEE